MIRLIEIREDGLPAEGLPISDDVRAYCNATAVMYQKTSFQRPWVGYLAVQDGQAVGTCAFKTPPRNCRVEIAYCTFPEYEGQGIATEMARQLILIANATDADMTITAQTLAEENASASILRKLGFIQIGNLHDPEDGELWEWQLPTT